MCGIWRRPRSATRCALRRGVKQMDAKSVLFDVEAWDGDRKIGDGTHRRGVINVAAFEKRFGVT